MLSLSTVFLSLSRISSWILNVFLLLPPQSVSWFQFYLRLVPSVKTSHLWPPSPFSFCSSGVNESRQVLQEQPDFAQSLLREPNTPIVRKSRGTSTQVGLQRQQWFKKKSRKELFISAVGVKSKHECPQVTALSSFETDERKRRLKWKIVSCMPIAVLFCQHLEALIKV